jgi:hypothetical protein
VQVVRLIELLFAILGLTDQLFPILEDLFLLGPDLVSMFWMSSAEFFSFLTEGCNFVFECSQITFQAIVFALKGLDAAQVLTKVVCGQEGILLVDPGNGFIGIAIEPKKIS